MTDESCCTIPYTEDKPSFEIASYQPLGIMVLVVLGGSVTTTQSLGVPFWPMFMPLFMGWFFLVFSMFKLFNVAGFARDFRVYDVVAQRLPAYAYAYPFIELLLGLSYLAQWNDRLTNMATFIIMGVGLVGVVRFYRSGQVGRCACMGSVLNVPVGSVTILENATMMLMAFISLCMMA